MNLNWPLMANNITDEDFDILIKFLKGRPRLTQSGNVQAFEDEWSKWLGVRYSVFVNSGASANLITIAALKHLYGSGEIIVPTLTWVSDIASVVQNGFTPVFVDINPQNLSMDTDHVLTRLSDKTKAVFITHVQGFNGLNNKLLKALKERKIPLIEDVCEAHGATFRGKKLGSFGTNDKTIYETIRMLRSHGMVRETSDKKIKKRYVRKHSDLSPDFIFVYPAYNVRNTEIGAVLGRSQLKRLDENNVKRSRNFELFLNNLDPAKYRTDFDLEGSSNYAFNLVLIKPDTKLRKRVEDTMNNAGVEFRRGSSGGGNQLRQPYLRGIVPEKECEKYPEIEHVHFFGYYIGNYPDLEESKILKLCHLLNAL
jgi:CDP-6-deoxy-D-xylo-4-hexulose-3-dehydrase